MSLPGERAPLWRWPELARTLGLGEQRGPDVTGVAIDSRRLAPGDLFIALTGRVPAPFHGDESERDGHAFVGDAARNGAAGALVDRPCDQSLPELRVADTFDALWRLGRVARDRCSAHVFAITGSSGKTTAKAMLGTALDAYAAEGSFNNHYGVPLSLARLPADARHGVFEVGMNHPGEIAPLAKLIRPHVALVLNVLPVHLQGLGDLEAVRCEKLSLAAGLEPNGTLVVPEGLATHDLSRDLRRLTFGTSQHANVRLEQASGTMRLRLPDGEQLPLTIPGGGLHRALTATAVVACVFAAGGDTRRAAEHLAWADLPPGRGNRVDARGVVLIDESYNANPVSTRHALQALAAETGGRRLALLGDMRELGVEAEAYHRALAENCAPLDGVWCVGELMAELYAALPSRLRAGYAEGCTTLDLDALAAKLAPGDIVLIKGSNRLFWKHDTVAGLRQRLETRGGAPPR